MSERKSPRFQIEVIKDREVIETVKTRNLDKANPESEHFGQNFIEEVRTTVHPVSYMIYFPGGHSVWFATKAAMASAGIVENENFEIDLDTGLPVDPKVIVNLKQRVENNTRSRVTR
jgi:hypothetical protein